jgi:hypothetical protein
LRFQFIGTYADFLNQEKKNELRKAAAEIFGLINTRRN